MRQIMNADEMAAALDQLTAQIAEQSGDTVYLVGIRRRGIPLAERLGRRLAENFGKEVHVGSLDIAFYRDDLSQVAEHPVVGVTDLAFEVNDKPVFLIDDVLYTGRTVRAALEALMHYGRPERIALVAFVDRGHRELPVQADMCVRQVETAPDENVKVCLEEVDGRDEVYVKIGGDDE